MTGEGGQAVNQREAEKLLQIDRALTIVAEMFAAEGYCAANGDDSPAAIRRFLIMKARQELEAEKGLTKKEPRAL